MALALHLDLIISAFINLRSFWVTPFSYFLNSVIALAVIIFYIYLIVNVFIQSIRLENLRIKISNENKEKDPLIKDKLASAKRKKKNKKNNADT